MLNQEALEVIATAEFHKRFIVDTFRYKYDPNYKSNVDFRIQVYVRGFERAYMMIQQGDIV